MKAIDTKEKDSKLSLLSIFGVGVFLLFISMSLYLAYLYYNSPTPSSINKNDTINLTLIAEPVLASTGDIVSLQDARCKYYGKLVNAKDEFGGARGLYFQVNDKVCGDLKEEVALRSRTYDLNTLIAIGEKVSLYQK
ncbi:TPA: hypothetical protein ACIV48_004362 [Salmonella enterica subsp. enterica serovar Saintpaul]|nr:hypothetical protein [Salmonella enterica subsp. enterica serovar Stanley]EBG2553057.1 hypothetical protein [Salmonella enterica subsp. enterica serovar Braenderup]EBX3015934.1 hypothetical protein [Salmonella enterica subsp. enterica serovar Typhimurium]EEA6077224.1 hypothetical protein [Salmonella enterica subsp. enterica serovar Enteritidis]EFX0394909.1 hypothetical protein [Shigella sonnei]EKH1606432.1 hypothetical protein [Escherichia coli]MLL21125.1 hypothetical protein [Salmonella e